MDGWAAYLRGQADALSIPVVDTTTLPTETGVAFLRQRVEALLARCSRAAEVRCESAAVPGSSLR